MGQLSVFSSSMIARIQEVQINDRTLMQLNTTTFSKNKVINRVARTEANKVYKHMRVGQSGPYKGQYVCTIQIIVYKPINDAQSKELNNLRANTSYAIAAISAVTAGVLTRGMLKSIKLKDTKNVSGKKELPDEVVDTMAWGARFGGGYFGRNYALEELQAWDADDVLIALDARVSGGTGQSGSIFSVVVKRSIYNPVAPTS